MQLAARGQHAVHKDTLVRVGAAAAIVAGLLRAAAAVAPGTDGEVERQSCISLSTSCLLGVLAAYAQHHKALGRSGRGRLSDHQLAINAGGTSDYFPAVLGFTAALRAKPGGSGGKQCRLRKKTIDRSDRRPYDGLQNKTRDRNHVAGRYAPCASADRVERELFERMP